MPLCLTLGGGRLVRVASFSIASSKAPIVRAFRAGPIPVNLALTACSAVDRDEVDRLRKRFMKLDKVRSPATLPSHGLLLYGAELMTPTG